MKILVQNTEIDLVEKARLGDKEAFTKLYRKHSALVQGLVRPRCKDSDFDDICQTTWMFAWKYLGGLKNPERFSQWLHSIARNACKEQFRQNQKRDNLQPLMWMDFPAKETDEADTDTLKVLGKLRERDKEMLVDQYLNGMDRKELARKHGISLECAKSRLHRAKLEAKRLITDSA